MSRRGDGGGEAGRRGGGPYWVFAYGSLMWDPGFPYVEKAPAMIRGYHRAFCIYSVEYRGTPERPGLVLGLDHGGACRGIAYRVAAEETRAVRAYLYARELSYPVYAPKRLAVALDGCAVTAEAFVVNRRHDAYAGKLSAERVAAIIRAACGRRGSNREYLDNTVRHLEGLGIADGPLHRLRDLVG